MGIMLGDPRLDSLPHKNSPELVERPLDCNRLQTHSRPRDNGVRTQEVDP